MYLIILQLAGLYLAIKSKVVRSIPSLNDSKFVIALIYVSSVTLGLTIFTHVQLSEYWNIGGIVFDSLLLALVVAFLGLVFGPKVCTRVCHTSMHACNTSEHASIDILYANFLFNV